MFRVKEKVREQNLFIECMPSIVFSNGHFIAYLPQRSTTRFKGFSRKKNFYFAYCSAISCRWHLASVCKTKGSDLQTQPDWLWYMAKLLIEKWRVLSHCNWKINAASVWCHQYIHIHVRTRLAWSSLVVKCMHKQCTRRSFSSRSSVSGMRLVLEVSGLRVCPRVGK